MVRRGAALVMGGLIMAAGLPSRADECFCLMHPATGAVLRGCQEYKAPHDFFATAVCTDPETGLHAEQTIYTDWQRIEEGADRCDPCRRMARGVAPEVPRQPDNDSRP